jgi:ATP-dependent helicase HrpB
MPVPHSLRDLPVLDVLDDVVVALRDRRSAVLVAPPGAGKTTVVPLRLLDEPWLDGRRIVVLEPRRLAARAAARRMASLLGEPVGATVGYQTRDERHISEATRIEVVTEGVLTRRLQSDPELPGVGVVIFDEVHERNLPTDIGLAFVLDARRNLRPDLAVLAMSATPDSDRFARVLGSTGDPAPIVHSDGRQFPVEVRWRPMAKQDRLEHATAEAIATAIAETEGDVLVFLPGIGEIRRVEQVLAVLVESRRMPSTVDVHALAGALSLEDQDRALAASPAGRRRVVLSTDIAESSLTVDGVAVVVDAGLARVPRFDARSGMTRLTTVATSRASADQRAGRAGRLAPGTCYRLWSKLEHATRLAHLPAEITQVDLAGLALELAAWHAEPADLDFLDAPPAAAWRTGRELLVLLGALDDDGALTATGRSMLSFGLHPRLARMVTDAPEHLRPLACVVAAVADDRDVLRGRPDTLPVDLALRVGLVVGDARDDRADRRAVERVRERTLDIARRAGIRLVLRDVDPARCGLVAALAFPDRIGARRSQPGQWVLRTGGGAWTAKDDAIATERFVVALDLDGNRTNARVRLGAAVDAAEIEMALAADVERTEVLLWDKTRDDLVVRVEHRLGSLLVDEQIRPPTPGTDTVAALLERLRVTRLAALRLSDADGFRARIAFVRDLEPDAAWPDLSTSGLVAGLDTWLGPYLVRATGRADLERIDVPMVLAALLDWDQGMRLAELAPPTLTTPSGRTVPIRYERDLVTASVRVQDLFGQQTHPSVGAGRVPVALELLSPADRPIQITSDLPGFWSGTWTEVRKEMAGRYPKHQWPTDPATATPKRLKDR